MLGIEQLHKGITLQPLFNAIGKLLNPQRPLNLFQRYPFGFWQKL